MTSLLAPPLSGPFSLGLKAAGKAVAAGQRSLEDLLPQRLRDPMRLALDLLNGFNRGKGAGKGGGALGANPVLPREITINDIAYQKSYSQGQGYIYETATANIEVSFDITGVAYQRLINGMAARAGSPMLPVGADQVNVGDVYTVQLGLSVQFNGAGRGLNEAIWQGAFQVVDKVTGQGSLGYGWEGNVAGNLVQRAKSVAKQILASPATGYYSDFYQPTTLGTGNQVPQQPVALAFVQNVIGQTPNISWPMTSVLQGAGPFDPIPGADTPFVPTSFGVS